jgi:hypothetical protein
VAGSLTDAAEVDLLKMLTGQPTTIFTTTPITPYLGLFTTAPTDPTSGTEAAGGGYARVNTGGKWGDPVPGSVLNDTLIALATFAGVVSGGAPFVAFGIFTALTGGTLIGWGLLADQTKTGGAGDQMEFPPGDLAVTAD